MRVQIPIAVPIGNSVRFTKAIIAAIIDAVLPHFCRVSSPIAAIKPDKTEAQAANITTPVMKRIFSGVSSQCL